MNARIVFAGDRYISVKVLRYLISQGINPLALGVADGKNASHKCELIKICAHLGEDKILRGKEIRSTKGIDLIKSLNPDYIICVHFPYIIPKSILDIPMYGVINLHPAFLPFNRGWHTPSWAILENTKFGATLHFMTEKVDEGDIIHQKVLEIKEEDTANTLYKKVLDLEYEVFIESWPSLLNKDFNRIKQYNGTSHLKKDLFNENVQVICLTDKVCAGDLIRRLRALTTNKIEEAAYYVRDGHKYYVQVRITKK